MNSRIGLAALAVGLVFLLGACEQSTAPSSSTEDAATTPVVPDGVTFVDAVERKPGDEVVIPYRRFRLDNGLTVILHPDASDPLVHVDVTYHVGSAREEVGKSGFAHFFEHMMFQGSENVGDEQHFKIISESGGTLNGTTSTDRMNYFQTAPANQLEKLLWLEADRMGFLLDAVTQEKFEVQRETVKNERGQRVDNVPYGLLRERVGEALFPEGHPYSWMTIGYVEDLDRVDVNDLKKFFLRWYGPNNAVLTIGGDFDEAQTLTWLVKYFGPIPRGPDVVMPDKPAVTLDANRYISLEDNVRVAAVVHGLSDRLPIPRRRGAPRRPDVDPRRWRDVVAVQEHGEEPDRRAGAGDPMAVRSCHASSRSSPCRTRRRARRSPTSSRSSATRSSNSKSGASPTTTCCGSR